MEKRKDGSIKVSFDATHDEDVDSMIKSWLPHMEVLEPERFRQRLQNELESYLKRLIKQSIKMTPAKPAT